MNLYEILQNSGRVGEGMTHFERLFAQKVGGGKINEISGVPPLRYIGDGRPLTDYLLSGNTVQDGTPTPESPVPVEGCGTDAAGEWTLSLTVNGTEHPIYLGEVSTVRKIKKLVLDGVNDGEWKKSSTRTGSFYLNVKANAITALGLCDRAVNASTVIQYDSIGKMFVERSGTHKLINLWLFDTNISLDDFKSYLAAQYAAGTPVTVWYVLAEPETAVVNEPLMKIGDYADTISFAQAGVTIPTVNGENVLDVPTEVKPSEVWIRGRIKEV